MKYFIYCRKSSEAEDRQALSIESQQAELERCFGNSSEIEIVGLYREAYSAKAPGRTLFGEMLSRIERGEAAGIVAWHPDRLARNSVDGGRIIYLLDRKLLNDLKFATFTFENNPQGKFMLSIIFGYSKYYVDSLSENVKRGNRAKIERGWRPNMAPLGYLNDTATKTIMKDPVHFSLIRRMYELMLTGAYSPKRIAEIARDEWGFRTPKRRKIGGVPLAMSSTYKILTNPFYTGIIEWGGERYPGKHEPVVSLDEFERVQQLLGRPGRPKPKRHTFAYTGMIRCGVCGLMVTAEHKLNRYGYRYTYYHCTKRRLEARCPEPSVEAGDLEQQVAGFLEDISMPGPLEECILQEVGYQLGRTQEDEKARERSLTTAVDDVRAQLTELTSLRLRNLIDDAEFSARRTELRHEEHRLRERLAASGSGVNRFEPLRDFVSFSVRAVGWLQGGDADTKRLIVETVGSNLLLTGKRLNIQARKPFVRLAGATDIPHLLAIINDVRTLIIAQDEETIDTMHRIKSLIEMHEAKERKVA